MQKEFRVRVVRVLVDVVDARRVERAGAPDDAMNP